MTPGGENRRVNHRTPVLTCHLPEFLDSAAVSAVRGQAALHSWAHRIILEADYVARFDPVGVLRLWDFCVEQSIRGVKVELVQLHPALAHRLRAHPLLDYTSDEDRVFADPFGSFEASNR